MLRTLHAKHSFTEEIDGYRIECESKTQRCIHWLNPTQYSLFLGVIGQPQNSNLLPALMAAARTGQKAEIAYAIHKIPTTVYSEQLTEHN
jgi:hypothetical protein